MKARLPQGMGGGAQSMQGMLRQAQKMQAQMDETKERLAQQEYQVTAGGGVIEITIAGSKEIKALSIKPEAVDPDDVEMLQDLIIAAVNEAIRLVEDTYNKEMEKITGSLSIPGMF